MDYEIYYKEGKGLRFAFPYNPEIVAAIKSKIQGVTWDKEAKRWTLPEGVPLEPHVARSIKEFAKQYKLNVKESAAKYLGITGLQTTAPKVGVKYNSRNEYSKDTQISIATSEDGQYIVVRTPYDKNIVDHFHKIGGAKFDTTLKQWLLPIENQKEADNVIEYVRSRFPESETEGEERLEKVRRETAETEKQYPGSFMISEGEGYGGREFKEGEVLRWHDKGIVKVISSKKKYFGSDGMSFGVGDEKGYVYSARVMPATEEIAKPVLEAEAKYRIVKEASNRIKRIKNEIFDRRNRVDDRPDFPEGEKIENTFNIYGGGEQIIIEPDKAIWYIRNNGADGDNWGDTNIGNPGYAGAIGFRVPYSKELANELKQLKSLKENPQPDSILPKPSTIKHSEQMPSKPIYRQTPPISGRVIPPEKPLEVKITKTEADSSESSTINQAKRKSTTVRTNTPSKLVIEVNKPNLLELKQFQTQRSKLGQKLDLSKKHSIVISYVNPKTRKWLKNPGKMDILGIDAPKGTRRVTSPAKPKLNAKRRGKLLHIKGIGVSRNKPRGRVI